MLTQKKQLNDIVVQLIICVAYFELDRVFEIYGANGEPWFILTSQIVAACTLALFVFNLLKRKNLYNSLNYMFFLILIYAIYAIFTTYVNQGSLRAGIGHMYPNLAMYALINLSCCSQYSTEKFLKTISNTYILLSTINLLFIIILPKLFGEHRFFLGLENHIGFMLILGELFVYLDCEASGKKKKLFLYHIICSVSLILIFSGSNIIGMLIIAVYFIFPKVRKFIKNRPIIWFYGLYIFVWINVVFMTNYGLLTWTPVRFVIENILGKNITFSGRMYIWETAVPIVIEKFWIGHGITSSPNHFYVYKLLMGEGIFTATFSAHNQVLQSMYEIGFIGVLIIAVMIFVSEYNISKIKNKNVSGIFRIIIIALLVMLMSEAVGWATVIVTLSLVPVMAKFECNYKETNKETIFYENIVTDNMG